jgi:fumarate reductase flavoprotein subunit
MSMTSQRYFTFASQRAATQQEPIKEYVMIKTKSRLTRRQFVLATSAAAATPLMMNAVSTAASENPVRKVASSQNYPVKKNLEYDLVIIGGGLSGLVAATRAAELGIKKIGLFEKGKIFGGNGLSCNSFVSSDFADYGDYHTDTNSIKLYRRAMNMLNQTGDPELIQRYLFATKRVAKWLEDRRLNEKWKPAPTVGHPEFTSDCSRNVETNEENVTLGLQICKVMIAECKTRSNVEMHLNSPAVKLLTDKNGDVRGAVVKLSGGEYAEVSAKKVILACGGVCSNEALCKWLPKYMAPGDYMQYRGVNTCSGDGIEMAAAIGAEVGKEMNIHLLGPSYAATVYIKHGTEEKMNAIGNAAGDPRVMVLSKKGVRIIDETYSRDGRAVCSLVPGKVFYTFLGSNSIKTVLTSSSSPGGSGEVEGAQGMPQQGQGEAVAVEEIPTRFAADIKKGALCVAKDLDEAAKFIGCDVKTLKASLDRYEAACQAGYDSHLLKAKENLLSPGGPPYYIILNVRSLDTTQGGITTNKDFAAITPAGRAIGGMYVVGDHVTGFVTSDYYGPGGAGFTFAMAGGFLCAEDAAKYILRT